MKQLKDFGTLSSLRASTNNFYVGDRDAGWHLSWMGDADKRRRKLSSIAEYYIWDKPEVQKLCDEFKAEEGKTDMLGRQDHLITSYPVDKLPEAALRIERVKITFFPMADKKMPPELLAKFAADREEKRLPAVTRLRWKNRNVLKKKPVLSKKRSNRLNGSLY